MYTKRQTKEVNPGNKDHRTSEGTSNKSSKGGSKETGSA